MEIKVKNIQWDTDGDAEAFEQLPNEVTIPNDRFEAWSKKRFSIDNYEDESELLDDISDFLSDEYEYCHNGFEVEEPVVFPKTNYEVTVSDSAIYVIKASSETEARTLALKYFHTREPELSIVKTDEEAEE